MIINKNIKINISYKLKDQDSWIDLDISPIDYFWEGNEDEIDFDSIPTFDHAIDYISDEKKEKVTHTKLIVRNVESSEQRLIKETLWNGQQNVLIERTDSGGLQDYFEMIISTIVSTNPTVYQIISILKKDSVLKPISHVFITDNDDGSQSEQSVLNI